MAIHDISRACQVKCILPTSSATTGTYKLIDNRFGYTGALITVMAGTNAATGTVAVTVAEPTTRGGGAELGLASQRMASTNHLGVTSAAFTSITTSNDVAYYCAHVNLNARKRYFSIRRVRASAASCNAVHILLYNPTYLPTTLETSLAFSV